MSKRKQQPQISRDEALRNFCNNLRQGAAKTNGATFPDQKRDVDNGSSVTACIASMITSVNCVL